MKRPRSLTLPSNILHSLAQLQDGLNAMIDPSWRAARTLDDWSLAIVMETAELLDSYPWKWWKNVAAPIDFNNVRIELVDILHFSLSGTMQLESACSNSAHKILGKDLRDIFEPVLPATEEYTTAVDGMLFLPLSDTRNAIASFRNIIHLANAYRFDRITEAVVCAADSLNFNLVAYYVAKHTLNFIRQIGGYKKGSYNKNNCGVEDNVLLHDSIKHISVDEAINEEQYISVWDGVMTSVYDTFQVNPGDRRTVKQWLFLQEKPDA